MRSVVMDVNDSFVNDGLAAFLDDAVASTTLYVQLKVAVPALYDQITS